MYWKQKYYNYEEIKTNHNKKNLKLKKALKKKIMNISTNLYIQN